MFLSPPSLDLFNGVVVSTGLRVFSCFSACNLRLDRLSGGSSPCGGKLVVSARSSSSRRSLELRFSIAGLFLVLGGRRVSSWLRRWSSSPGCPADLWLLGSDCAELVVADAMSIDFGVCFFPFLSAAYYRLALVCPWHSMLPKIITQIGNGDFEQISSISLCLRILNYSSIEDRVLIDSLWMGPCLFPSLNSGLYLPIWSGFLLIWTAVLFSIKSVYLVVVVDLSLSSYDGNRVVGVGIKRLSVITFVRDYWLCITVLVGCLLSMQFSLSKMKSRRRIGSLSSICLSLRFSYCIDFSLCIGFFISFRRVVISCTPLRKYQ